MSDAAKVVIIGAGHNGLVAAAHLARAGHPVLVLEQREVVGGAAVSEEVYPGFKFETAAHRIGGLHPAVARQLASGSGGPHIEPADPTVFAPTPDGGHLHLWRDPAKSAESIRAFSKADSERWGDFTALVNKVARLLAWLYERPPPDLFSRRPADIWQLLRSAGRTRRLGKRDMMEVLRVLPMTVKELLDEWFASEELKGVLGAAGITGVFQGPMASGTAYLFMHHHAWSPRGVIRPAAFVRGGIGTLAHALSDLARRYGAKIRTGCAVERIVVEEGRATGVVLAGGEVLKSSCVASNADPKRTFLNHLDPLELEPTFLRAVSNLKFRGSCAKVNLALGELPEFTSVPGNGPHLRGAISISPSLEYLERAYDDAKYGRPSGQPYLEAVIPSLGDPTLSPPGKHVMSVLVQYAPYQLKEGAWDDERREALGDIVVERLADYAPNLKAAILHRQVLTPLDLEDEFGLTEGNIYHGEMTLDRLLFMRPIEGWSRYRTPIGNLYLCGAGTHPGGGITGAPGYNAAQEILKDLKHGR